MKLVNEKNIQEFNRDVKLKGRYEYTDPGKYSSYIANKRQTAEIVSLLTMNYKKGYSILDVGCGDGTYTQEYFTAVKPGKIVGFDTAEKAVLSAIKKNKNKKIDFQCINAYQVTKKFKYESFDIVVIRGVLHHLYDPEKAIKSISKISRKIIVLEPNGYNPILKVIEKASPYHRRHEERSYWPPTLNKWFEQNGFKVKKQKFCVIVPYFSPEPVARLLKVIEPFMERIPLIHKIYCGTNVILYER